MYGVDTEAFRKAENGQFYINHLSKKFNFPFKILNQTDEAKYGFLNAKVLTGLDENKIISWDCGAGSY